ncbi:hypothetical protein SAMN05421863_102635 [Nitrosomonas communis]|uniref:Uncharacterized protein n=1 Tax=Nitrosomonas communis TaxID=44574 RepID=A0A1I4QG22_9PROT|nr:hypothetical protein SAMN05421863_102635 [Nitrosomonas communis]
MKYVQNTLLVYLVVNFAFPSSKKPISTTVAVPLHLLIDSHNTDHLLFSIQEKKSRTDDNL